MNNDNIREIPAREQSDHQRAVRSLGLTIAGVARSSASRIARTACGALKTVTGYIVVYGFGIFVLSMLYHAIEFVFFAIFGNHR